MIPDPGCEGPEQPSGALKSCPFCGVAGAIREDDGRFCVVCTGDDCFTAIGEGYDRSAIPDHVFTSEEDAAKAWNRRAEQQVERL